MYKKHEYIEKMTCEICNGVTIRSRPNQKYCKECAKKAKKATADKRNNGNKEIKKAYSQGRRKKPTAKPILKAAKRKYYGKHKDMLSKRAKIKREIQKFLSVYPKKKDGSTRIR